MWGESVKPWRQLPFYLLDLPLTSCIENGKKWPERNAPRPRLSKSLPELGQTGGVYSRHQAIEHVVDLFIVVVHRMGADPEPDAVA